MVGVPARGAISLDSLGRLHPSDASVTPHVATRRASGGRVQPHPKFLLALTSTEENAPHATNDYGNRTVRGAGH